MSSVETIEQVEKYMKLVDNFWVQKDWRAVIYYCGQILESSPGLTEYTLKKAQAMIYRKQVAEAHNLAIDALRLDVRNVDAIFVRGLSLFYEDNMDKAIDHFRQALAFDPGHDNSMSYFKKIKTLKAKKEEAGKLLMDKTSSKQIQASNAKDALAIYKECLLLEPLNDKVNSRLHFNISICYGKMDQNKLALESVKEAIDLDKDYEKALLRKVTLLMKIEKLDEAVREAESLYKKTKNDRTRICLEEARSALKKSKHKDYYKILGVDKSAGEEEIKKAYKKMAMVHHPDRHSNASEEERKVHEKKFKDLGEAYTVLSDRTKKMRYDNGQDVNDVGFHEQSGFPHGFDPNDIFASFFSGGGSPFGTRGTHFSFGGGGRRGFP
jgi:DnaJ family protein C protein 7